MTETISTTSSLGIIGVGAFGEFMLKHLTPYFDITIFDAHRNLDDVKKLYRVQTGSITDAASCDVIVLAVPVRQMEDTIKNISPHLRAGQLVIEVASVKVLPDQFLKSLLPAGVDAVGLHPLFGPQSGKYGIHGFNIALCNVNGARKKCVAEFLQSRLGLNVYETTPEDHDRQMAYVQILTHLIGKAFVKINPPNLNLTTKTYDLLCDMVELIRYDSDELFKAIQTDNPYAHETKENFFTAVRELEEFLKG
jgi:prephenate dehydrogenase